jgi:hypothetical protein
MGKVPKKNPADFVKPSNYNEVSKLGKRELDRICACSGIDTSYSKKAKVIVQSTEYNNGFTLNLK